MKLNYVLSFKTIILLSFPCYLKTTPNFKPILETGLLELSIHLTCPSWGKLCRKSSSWVMVAKFVLILFLEYLILAHKLTHFVLCLSEEIWDSLFWKIFFFILNFYIHVKLLFLFTYNDKEKKKKNKKYSGKKR